MPSKNKKFLLATQEVLQGDFKLEDLNLLLVFQVNCPGCFVYALPVAAKLHAMYQGKDVKVLALSTAFEDFELNTIDNTRKLLKTGELVGATKQTLEQAGQKRYSTPIKFDVAFDKLAENDARNTEKQVEKYCESFEGFAGQNAATQKAIKDQVRRYFADKRFSAYTFDANNLHGTPSWILFDKDLKIFFHTFGHADSQKLITAIQDYKDAQQS